MAAGLFPPPPPAAPGTPGFITSRPPGPVTYTTSIYATDGTRPPGPPNPIVNPPSPPPPPPDPSAPTAAEQQEAKGIIRQQLDSFGLGALVDWAYEQVIVNDLSIDYVIRVLLPEQQAFKDRFWYHEERKKAGLPVYGAADYIRLETEIWDQFRLAGIDDVFAAEKSRMVGNYIARNVSAVEVNARLQDFYVDVMNAPEDVRQGFQVLYGVQGDSRLAAYFADPERALPELQRQEAAARVYGAGVRTGFGVLSRGEAERIGALGLSEGGVMEGFTALAESRPLFTAIDEGEETIDRATQLAAAFEGNTVAQQTIARRRRRRQAEFEEGGSFVASQEGFAGLGSAS